MRVSRAGTFVGGIVCAVVVGGGTAVATNGAAVITGQGNAATTTTGITNAKGTALSLTAKTGVPPLKVSNTVKVKNLNSDLLDGKSASAFLPTTGTAADSERLGGQPASAYLASGGTAADSAKLGGLPPSAFLASTGTAADSAELAGQPASSYVPSVYVAQTTSDDEALLYPHAVIDSMSLPAGTYSIAFTAEMANRDTVADEVKCYFKYTETTGNYFGPESTATLIAGSGGTDTTYGSLADSEVITLPATTTTVAYCFVDFGDAGHTAIVFNSSLTATKMLDLHGTPDVFNPALEVELLKANAKR